MMYEAVYADGNGVLRVWGTGNTESEARMNAALALEEYLERRPDKTRDEFTLAFGGIPPAFPEKRQR